MTGNELDALERLCESATPAPWSANVTTFDSDGLIIAAHIATGPVHRSYCGDDCDYIDCRHRCGNGERDKVAADNDAAFIAAARAAVPALIAEVRELTRALDDWREEAEEQRANYARWMAEANRVFAWARRWKAAAKRARNDRRQELDALGVDLAVTREVCANLARRVDELVMEAQQRDDALATARREALDEAAAVCEQLETSLTELAHMHLERGDEAAHYRTTWRAVASSDCAGDIRALATREKGGG